MNSNPPKKTVVILLSDKRSGSTIVQNELVKHPDIQHVEYTPHTYFETMHWLKGASLLQMPKQTYYGHAPYETFKSTSVTKDYMQDCLVGNGIDTESFGTDEELIFDGWEALCHKFSQPVFFEKSPQYIAQWCCLSLILRWMEKTDFDVKFIGLVRNPLSVMYSARQLFHTQENTRQFGWADMYRNLLAFQALVPPDSFLHVKYEDLIHSPQSTFVGITDFLGVPKCEAVGQGVHAKSLEKWRTDQDFSLELHESVKQTARAYGYSADDLSNPGKTPRQLTLLERLKQKIQRAKNKWVNRVAAPWKIRRKLKRK